MSDQNESSGIQVNNESDKIACHLVSLPTILLTRIDKNTLKSFESQNVASKQSLNDVGLKKKKTTSPVKPNVKNLSPDKVANRPRGRPRKEVNVSKHSQKHIKKTFKPELTSRINKTTNKQKSVSKPQESSAKSILRKTMLQKISKVAIPQVKKSKLVKKTNSKQPKQKLDKTGKEPKQKLVQFNKQQKLIKSDKQSSQKIIKSSKQTSQKIIAPNSKNETRHKNTTHTDSSEDEFLYDQLIGQSQNTSSKYNKTSERTTNITLKPSKGNRPPTIVKGGIIKIDSLPADLKTIASPGQQLSKSSVNDSLPPKKAKLPQTDCPIPPKRPSPWPISMSTPSKVQNNVSPNKKRSISNKNSINSHVKQKITDKQKTFSAIKNQVSSKRGPDESLAFETQQIAPIPKKHKFGPKLSFDDEESLSDEYTEVETLEGLDYNVNDNYSVKQSVKNPTSASKKSTVSSVNTIRDDEDPNLDLLRILTDETDDCTPKPYENLNSRPVTKENKPSSANAEIEIDASISLNNSTINGSSPPEESFVVELKKNEEPKVRTIYDLINEVSLQRPSWNLHIIPETNAFCIAQVTKGRLGLPTLKKCIELDPEDYNAKVYIHQYHIKRFDGIYDSEESILNLIEEIDSIKA